MKISECITENVINEDLGTLGQLNAGNLINVLKQGINYSFKNNKADTISGDTKKFVSSQNIGSTSPIVDAGKVSSIADVRKAYKKNDGAMGFVLYIGNAAVIMGVSDQYTLAGPSRISRVAWDFKQFKEQFDAALEEVNTGKPVWSKKNVPVGSDKVVNTRVYDVPWDYKGEAPTKAVKYTGDIKTTADLAEMINLANITASQANQPLMMKLILADKDSQTKRMSRQKIQYELAQTGDDLRTRVAKYKLSKKPTASNIQEFIDAVMKQKLSVIQFAGSSYRLTSDDPVKTSHLFSGAPWKARYASAEPGNYGSVELTFAFSDGRIVPVVATYYDKTGNKQVSVTDVIDPMLYATRILKIRNPNDKDTVMKLLLTLLKEQKLTDLKKNLQVIRQLGNDWPELNIIEKSMNAELAKRNG